MQKDLLRLGSRLDPQDSSSPLTPPSSASPASSALSRRWRSGSPWPGADMLEQSDDTFSIEREARLHRQAAGLRNASKGNHCISARLWGWRPESLWTPQLLMKPPSPGVVSCLPGTTRILCIPARSFSVAFPGTSQKVTMTPGFGFVPANENQYCIAGSALGCCNIPTSVKLGWSRIVSKLLNLWRATWWIHQYIFNLNSQGKLWQCMFMQICSKCDPFYMWWNNQIAWWDTNGCFIHI